MASTPFPDERVEDGPPSLGEVFRVAREAAEIKIPELAKQTGILARTIERFENGTNTRLDNVLTLFSTVGVERLPQVAAGIAFVEAQTGEPLRGSLGQTLKLLRESKGSPLNHISPDGNTNHIAQLEEDQIRPLLSTVYGYLEKLGVDRSVADAIIVAQAGQHVPLTPTPISSGEQRELAAAVVKVWRAQGKSLRDIHGSSGVAMATLRGIEDATADLPIDVLGDVLLATGVPTSRATAALDALLRKHDVVISGGTHLGAVSARLREGAGWEQVELARRARLPRSTVHGFENTGVNTSAARAFRIFQALGVPNLSAFLALVHRTAEVSASPDLRRLGALVREARLRTGKTEEELAVGSASTPAEIAALEGGRYFKGIGWLAAVTRPLHVPDRHELARFLPSADFYDATSRTLAVDSVIGDAAESITVFCSAELPEELQNEPYARMVSAIWNGGKASAADLRRNAAWRARGKRRTPVEYFVPENLLSDLPLAANDALLQLAALEPYSGDERTFALRVVPGDSSARILSPLRQYTFADAALPDILLAPTGRSARLIDEPTEVRETQNAIKGVKAHALGTRESIRTLRAISAKKANPR